MKKQAFVQHWEPKLEEAGAAEARSKTTETMEEWDVEDLPQLPGLVVDDLAFETSKGDEAV